MVVRVVARAAGDHWVAVIVLKAGDNRVDLRQTAAAESIHIIAFLFIYLSFTVIKPSYNSHDDLDQNSPALRLLASSQQLTGQERRWNSVYQKKAE